MDKRVTDERRSTLDGSSRIHRLADGRHIGYAEYGEPDGLPAIALHGTPGSRYMFALTDAAARARRLRIIAPERPGYGLSDRHHFGNLRQAAGDVEALADALGLDRFALIGVSGGGPHAVAATHLLKERVLRLGLIGPVGLVAECDQGQMSSLHHFIFSYLAPSQHAAATFFEGFRTMLAWTPGLAFHILMQRVTDADREVLRRPEVRANLQAATAEGLRGGSYGAVQDLRLYCGSWGLPISEIDTPALVWQGSADTIVPSAAAYHLAGLLPCCQLEVIEGAGHYWIFGQFERVLDAMREAWD